MTGKYKDLKDYWKQKYKNRYGGEKGKEKKKLEMRKWRAKQKQK